MDEPTNDTVDGTNQDPRFVCTINNQRYYIEIYMFNQLEKFKPFPVNFSLVKGLAIEESLSTWVTKGWIVLSNDLEVIERGSPAIDGDHPEIEAPFCFRSDGRNKISIRVYPIMEGNNADSPTADSNVSSQLPPEYWEMCYDFVIYDIEDLPTTSSIKKLRKFYFWDERYQIFLERNIEWSTNLYGSDMMPIAGLSSKGKNSKIGAIESIITTAASNSSDPSNPVLKVGSSKGPSGIAEPDIRLNSFDVGNWDDGSPDSMIHYTSPACSNVIDDLSYMFNGIKGTGTSYLKAADNSPLFLQFNRYLGNNETKQWSLVPLTYFIKNSKDNQVERLALELGENMPISQEGKTVPRVDRAYPVDGASYIKNFQSGIASKITSYKIVPAVSLDTINQTNKAYHNYDFATGQYNIYFEKNTAKKHLETVGEIAKQGLFSYKKSNQLLFNIDRTKTLGLNVKNVFEPRTMIQGVAGIPDGPNINMMYDSIFLGQALHFTAPGLTLRTPGKFLFVDRDVSTGFYNPFDDKCIGQWMITSVKHIFTPDQYKNEVIATKLDSFYRWWDEIDTNDKYY